MWHVRRLTKAIMKKIVRILKEFSEISFYIKKEFSDVEWQPEIA